MRRNPLPRLGLTLLTAVLATGFMVGQASAAGPWDARSARYTISVTSTPPGATVYVKEAGDLKIGTTPLTRKAPKGTWTFVVKLDGYETELKTFRVRRTRRVQDVAVTLKAVSKPVPPKETKKPTEIKKPKDTKKPKEVATTGRILVHGIEEVDLIIDGKVSKVMLPHEVMDLEVGTHGVEVMWADGVHWVSVVDVRAGEMSEVNPERPSADQPPPDHGMPHEEPPPR